MTTENTPVAPPPTPATPVAPPVAPTVPVPPAALQSLMGDLTQVAAETIVHNDDGSIQTPSADTQMAAPWYLAEGIAGQGEKPEYLKDKFTNISEQAKAFTELESRFGGHKGAPEEYNLEFIKESNVAIDPNQLHFKTWLENSKKANISQEYLQETLNTFIGYDQSRTPNPEEERAKLGPDGAEKMNVLRQWAVNTLPADEAEAICYAATSAAFIRAIDKWRNGTQPTTTPADPKLIPPHLPMSSVAQLNQEMTDNWEKYKSDPTYRQEHLRRLEIATAAEGTRM